MPCYRRLPDVAPWGLPVRHARHQKANPGGGGGGGTGGGAGPGGSGGGGSGSLGGGTSSRGILANFGFKPEDQDPHPFEPADEGDPYYPGIEDFLARRARGGAHGGGGGVEDPGGGGLFGLFLGGGGGGYPSGPGLNPGTGQPPSGNNPVVPAAPSIRFSPGGRVGFGNRSKYDSVPDYLKDIFGPDPYGLPTPELRETRSVPDMPGHAEVRPGAVFGKNFRVPGGFDLPPEVAFKRRLERPRYEFGASTVRRRNILDDLFDAINGLLGNR